MNDQFDLKAFLNEHVLYEFEQTFIVPVYNRKNRLLNNHVWFAKYCHLRILKEFFDIKGSNYPDNVYCTDYDFDKVPFTYEQQRLNKHKLHLSNKRATNVEDGKWDTDLFIEVGNVSINFIQHIIREGLVPASKLDRWENVICAIELFLKK